MRLFCAAALRRVLSPLSAFLVVGSASLAATSTWVFYDTNGNLQYGADSTGNKIMDYSSAGYGAGGVALPQVGAKATVTPSGGDDTTAIQNAINSVAAMTPDANGFRGAVLLKPGTFHVSGTLNITTSGVVLSGSGSGDGGSVVNMTGGGFLFLDISGSGGYTRTNTVSITDSFVPSGATSLNVTSTSGFAVGDPVIVSRTVTSAWIHFMGMDTLTRSGAPQTWINAGTEVFTDRTVKAISGTRITFDVPLTDSFDTSLITGSVSKYTFSARISNCGVEHLKLIGAGTEQTGALYQAFSMHSVFNSWARDLQIQDTENSTSVDKNSKQVTVENVRIVHTYAQSNSAAPADFSLNGTQVLAVNCFVTGSGNTWPFIAAGPSTGPAVVFDCFADDRGMSPHQRWSTGLLCDLTNFPSTSTADKAGIAYSNRGNFGSGQGWDAGWSVAWNVTTQTLLVQAPPGVDNWSIGCTGTILSEAAPGSTTVLPNGIYESHGTAVTPGSLYLAQLKQRLGASALTNIGYSDTNGTALPVAAPTFSPAAGTYSTAQTVAITSATPGAAIRYTTNGTSPTSTSGTLYTGPISVAVTETVKAIAYEGGLSDSAVSTAAYTISAGGGGTTYGAADGFVNIPLGSTQSGTFTAQFDATPSISPSNTTLSLCSGSQTAYTGLACMVRFNTTGTIDARNGGAFAAATSIPFTGGTKYHFRLVVNVPAHTYSAFVTPAGGSEIAIGSNYAFRTEQAGIASLNTFNVDVNATPGGTVTVSSVTVTTSATIALEAESLTRTSTGATTTLQTDTNTSGGQWISLDSTATGQFVEFTTTSIPAGTYSVQMSYKTNNNRGILSLKVDGTQVGGTLDQYAATSTYPSTTFGNVTFASAGTHVIRLTATSKNASSTSFVLSADKFTLVGQ
jgi:hypothetical protein